VLRSKVDQNDQVVLSSAGLYVTLDGGQTAEAALTAAGLVAEKVVGVLGNFISIEIGTGNNVFKSDQTGIYLGNQVFANAPFRVNMAGQLTATQATITGTINATGGTFSGDITAYGTITGGTIVGSTLNGGTITGALIRTSESGYRVEMSSSGNLLGAYMDNSNYVRISPNISGSPGIDFTYGGSQKATISTDIGGSDFGFLSYVNAFISAYGNIRLNPGGVVLVSDWSRLAAGSTSSYETLQSIIAGMFVNAAFNPASNLLKFYGSNGTELASVDLSSLAA
jgi:hypothetical protein